MSFDPHGPPPPWYPAGFQWPPPPGMEPVPPAHVLPYPAGYAPPPPDYAQPAPGPAPAPPLNLREGQSEWHATDSIRWGDEDIIQIVTPPAGPGVHVNKLSRQLARAFVPRPLAWLLQFAASATPPAGEVNNIEVSFQVAIGCGQSRSTITVGFITLTAANGYKLPAGALPPQIILPASDLQVIGVVDFTPSIAGASTVNVGAMTSPFTRWD